MATGQLTETRTLLPVYGRRDGRRAVVAQSAVLDDDFSRLELPAYHWRLIGHGYVIGAKSRPRLYGASLPRPPLVRLHRLVYEHYHGAVPEGREVDHIDRDTLNNLPSNLRAVTSSENCANRGRPKSNTSGYHGICWLPRWRKWQAKITAKRREYYLGVFADPRDAAAAVNRAYAEHFPHVPPPNAIE